MSNNISSKWVLLIDDYEAVRSQLRLSLSKLGFARLHSVGNIKEALALLKNNRYDIILCDYALGDGTDGQQFLEYLRTHDLITRNTAFVMITAEQTYEKVVAAAECSPDDYILKPFTAAQFGARLEKLVENQSYFSAIDSETDAKNWERVVFECDKRLALKDRYFIELSKIKCSALMKLERFKEAANLFTEILEIRPIGWAKLGLARASLQLGKTKEAKRLTQEIIRETPQFMAAYDFLSKILAETGDKHEALLILQKARTISPRTMSRVRELSNLAVSAGRPEVAETVMRQALRIHRYSPVRHATDYTTLSKALVNQGKTKEALKVVQDAQASLTDESSTIILATSESIMHHAEGNTEMGASALARAMSFGDVSNLPANIAISIAGACMIFGKEAEATNIMQHVLRTHNGNESVRKKLQEILLATGKDAAQAHATIEDAITKDAIELNDMGVRKADSGELDEAADMLIIAADRLCHDLRIVGNAALVLAMEMTRNGIDGTRLSKCVKYTELLRKGAPDSPKLSKVEILLGRLLEQ